MSSAMWETIFYVTYMLLIYLGMAPDEITGQRPEMTGNTLAFIAIGAVVHKVRDLTGNTLAFVAIGAVVHKVRDLTGNTLAFIAIGAVVHKVLEIGRGITNSRLSPSAPWFIR
jgi:hypothetical protein